MTLARAGPRHRPQCRRLSRGIARFLIGKPVADHLASRLRPAIPLPARCGTVPGRRLRSSHGLGYPEPCGEWVPCRRGVRSFLRADVRGRDIRGDRDHPAALEGARRRPGAGGRCRDLGSAGGHRRGRIYFDITTPKYIPHHWYGIFAVWDGGLGIWGAIVLASVVGAWRVRRHGASTALFMEAVAPALLVAQAIGRIGNYFNQELFGGPTSLPWGLAIAPQFRPAGYARYATFQPTFLYELIFDLALAAALVWLGHHRPVRPPGLFALYVTGYSAFRVFEGIAARRPVRALPRAAPQHVRRQRRGAGRRGMVLADAAPAARRHRRSRSAGHVGPRRRGLIAGSWQPRGVLSRAAI